jgi:hypothetical protein
MIAKGEGDAVVMVPVKVTAPPKGRDIGLPAGRVVRLQVVAGVGVPAQDTDEQLLSVG